MEKMAYQRRRLMFGGVADASAGGADWLLGSTMRRHVQKAAIFVPRLWVVAALMCVLASARAAEAQEASLLQPQGLSRAGVYALRRLK